MFWIGIMLLDFGSMRLHICGKGNLFMVEVISGPNVLWQLYRPPGITRAFRQKGHTGHWEHKTLGHFMCPQTKRLGCYLLSTQRKDFLFVHHPILRKRGITEYLYNSSTFLLKIDIKVCSSGKDETSVEVLQGLCAVVVRPLPFIWPTTCVQNIQLFFEVFSSVQWR